MRVLFIDLDTTRPDHLGCYGYHRDTSPNLDAIAREGVRFENYYSSDAPCLPARAALISGRHGIHTGAVGHSGTAADFRLQGESRSFRSDLAYDCLPMVFRQQGMKTVSISPFAERHALWDFYAGFNEMHNTGQGGGESAEHVTPEVMKWIEANAADDDWFLHVNYWDPHTPYRAPLEFGEPFEDEPLPEWLTEETLAEHRQHVGPHSAHEIGMYDNRTNPARPRHPGEIRDMKELRQMIDGYDTGIRYVDSHVGQLVEALKAKGVWDDLAVIISSDHGENQGELGIYGEHGTADHITCRIPMIIRWPGGRQNAVDTGLHYNLELAPTVAELYGQEPRASWDGQSYAPAILTGEDCGREFLVVSQCCHVCQRGVRFGDWMYVRTYHDGFHLFPDEMLFDIANDPHEQNNLAGEHPDVCRQAVYYLNQWHDDMMKTMDSPIDPLWTVMGEGGPTHAKGRLPEYCRRLEATGRGWAVPELKRRHPGEFK